MSSNIFIAALFFCLAFTALSEKQPTVLTYVIEHVVGQSDDFVQITLSVQTEGPILSQAMLKAEQTIAKIKNITFSYCEKHSNKKQEKQQCKDIVEASQFHVEPKYHLVRKIPTFHIFILTHELTIQIKHLTGLGKLIDEILQKSEGLVTYHEFVWKAFKQVNPDQEAIKEGIKEGEELCEKMDQTLKRIIEVYEIQEIEEQEDEEDEIDEDLQPEDEQLTIFKFKVQCQDKIKKK